MSPRGRRMIVRLTRLSGIRWVQHGFRQHVFRRALIWVAFGIAMIAMTLIFAVIATEWSPLIGILVFSVAVSLLIGFLSSREQRIAREFQAKKCPICGYDLRASRRKCPECGNVIRTKPLQQNPPVQATAPVPKIELPKGFFSGLAAFAVGYSANDHGRLADAISLSQSRRGRIELLICLVICPLLSAISLALMIAFDQDTLRAILIVPVIAIFPGSIWILSHIHRLQKRRVHVCPLCGESFRGIQRACPSCGGHSEATDAPTVVTKYVQNFRDLRSIIHSPKGRMELLLCLNVCPAIGIAMFIGAGVVKSSSFTLGALILGGIFFTTVGFIWLIGRIFLMQSRQRHTCRACGRRFKGAWKCPHCGSLDVIAPDEPPDIASHRPATPEHS